MQILLQARSESDEMRQERVQLDSLKQQLQALKDRARGGGGSGSGGGGGGSGAGSVGGGVQRGGAGKVVGKQSTLTFESIPEDGDSNGEEEMCGAGVAASRPVALTEHSSPASHQSCIGAMHELASGAVHSEGGAGHVGGAGGEEQAARRYGGDVPEQRRATTEKEQRMLDELMEEHLRLRDERCAVVRSEGSVCV